MTEDEEKNKMTAKIFLLKIILKYQQFFQNHLYLHPKGNTDITIRSENDQILAIHKKPSKSLNYHYLLMVPHPQIELFSFYFIAKTVSH